LLGPMKESSGKEKALPHSIHALLQPKGIEEPTLSIFHLFGEPLVCLLLNGEERLCLAQISSRLLRGYSYNEIHNRRVALGITCVQCSPRQLELLRRVGAMPLSSRRCGTITKREAQRLVESFMQHLPAPPRLPENFVFEVEHHCGWGCSGLFVPTRYNSSRAKCVQCVFCRVFFSPNKFIFHCHSAAETGVQQQIVNYRHPDAANFNAWRRHLLLADPNPPDSLLFAWEDIKAMFNGGNRTKKASLPTPLATAFTTTITATTSTITSVEAVEENLNEPEASAACYAPPKRPTPLGFAPLVHTDVPMLKPHVNLPSLMSQHTSEVPNYLWLSGLISRDSVQSQSGSSSYGAGSGDVCGTVNVNDSLSEWAAHLREYFEKMTQVPIDVDVDLDAADDRSEYSIGSRASVSTSGVSSLLPRSHRNEHTTVKSPPKHVAPLRFIMENNEGETSKSPPSSSKAILSATAQRILHSLERHGSTMSSSNKIPSLAPIPFSPLSTPLQRSTTRYPSYMATYNRYKEFKRRFAVQSSTPSVLPQFSIACNRIEEHGDEDATRRKDDTTAVTRPSAFEFSSESSQALKSTSIQPHGALAISEKSQPVVICHSGATVANSAKTLETTDKVGSHVPSTAHDACTSAKLPVEKEFSSLNQQTKFVFSNPIALGPPARPPVTLPDASGFTFSNPKSQFKRPAPVENSSFLPILMSSRQPVSDHPCPFKKASVPLDLDLWRCESCLMENSGRDSVCKSCHLPASVPSSSKSNSSNATSDKPAFLVNLPSNGWECPTCMVQNKMGVSECVCCHTLNPSSEVTADASKEKVATAPVFNFGPPKSVSSAESFCAVSAGDKAPISGSAVNFGISVTSSSPNPPQVARPITQSSLISSKGWSCPTCLVKNDDSLKNCPCCKTAKPKSSDSTAPRAVDCASIPGFSFTKPAGTNATPTTVTFCFGSNSDQAVTTNFKFGDSAVQQNEIGVKLAKTDKNKWECPTCMVKNSDNISSCPCCQTKKPTFSLKLAPGIPNESGDKWACPTCLVRNDVLVDLCPCCQTKKPSKSSSDSVGGEETCASCLAKNGAFVSKCISCQVKKPDIDPLTVSSSGTSVDSVSRPPQYASSPPVVMSTLRPFLNFGSQNPNTSSCSSFPAAVVTTPSFSFSKPADASNTSTKGLEIPVTSISSNLKNGVFNFGTPATTSGFDFSAKKENVTPVVSATTSNFSSVSFNFGSSIVPAPAFKFGQPKLSSGGSSYDAGNTSRSMFFTANIKRCLTAHPWCFLIMSTFQRSSRDRIEWTSDSAGSAKAEQGIADVCSVAIGTYINVSCGAFL
uniref:C-SKI_SMAD_bind domain-containing protein n=1 Tax=Taenia asiatica TaxID=60517 RepID=A0A0R3WD31_TAEAS